MLAQSPKLSLKEYLALEADSPVKYEYFDGEVFAMAGATDAHVAISGNLFAELQWVERAVF
ncbi:MAG: Uma2 family endonuclease [Cyanobacteria bacterium P01_D01_bin.73]